jgi:Spy/CpxP family protein refolding chaperone
MHPAFLHWWKEARRAERYGYGAWAGCAPGASATAWHASRAPFGEGASFGVRRPLRFLAYKLDLSETQVNQLAKILAELKTERAQADVDERRALSQFADAVSSDAFDEPKVAEAARLRVASAERLRDAVASALRRIHAILDAEQREQLAYLIRTGTLVI